MAVHPASVGDHQDGRTVSGTRAVFGGLAILAVGLTLSGGGGASEPGTAAPDPAAAAAPRNSDGCVTVTGGEASGVTADQSKNAKTIVAAAGTAGLDTTAAKVAVATALVESDLINVSHGDRDSVGLFQQRTSQGWGSVAQIMDPVYSAGKFYAAMKDVPGWQDKLASGDNKTMGALAQAVQRSAFPGRYAQRMDQAAQIIADVTGAEPGAVGCDTADPTNSEQVPAGAPPNLAPALAWAVSKNGSPYIWGGTGPTGWDCSGFTQEALSKVGIKTPRVAEAQRQWLASGAGTRVQPGQERAGDLLFSQREGRSYHVVIIHDPAKKKTIEASQTCDRADEVAGKNCGVGFFDYQRRIDSGNSEIYRVKVT